jgi:membrane-associated phospholipid phosphatase
MNPAVARTLSILGHPLLVLPAAALLATATGKGAGSRLLFAAGAFAVLALLIQGWSWWQVRRGRWQHVDASQRAERHTLNLVLVVLLPVAAWLSRQAYPELALGLLCTAAIVALGIVLRRWLKLSLHAACASYAAIVLFVVGPLWMLAGLVFAALVCWSRLVLKRHSRTDLVVGAMAGLAAGGVVVALT